MVPAEFTGYFTAAAAAAGVLIGLLFVAVSLRSETVFGDGASAAGRARVGSAGSFTGATRRTLWVLMIGIIAVLSAGALGCRRATAL